MDYYICPMHIHLCCIGKTDDNRLSSLAEAYCKRLPHYTKFSYTQLPDIKNRKSLTKNQQKEKEAALFLEFIPDKESVVLFDEKGKSLDSMSFANYLQKKQLAGIKKVWFLIGGPYGFSSNLYTRSQEKISLSSMTFSHQMVRLFALEQLYRAFTILSNEPYHHR